MQRVYECRMNNVDELKQRSLIVVVWPTFSCFADWSKRRDVTFVIIICHNDILNVSAVDGSTFLNDEPLKATEHAGVQMDSFLNTYCERFKRLKSYGHKLQLNLFILKKMLTANFAIFTVLKFPRKSTYTEQVTWKIKTTFRRHICSVIALLLESDTTVKIIVRR